MAIAPAALRSGRVRRLIVGAVAGGLLLLMVMVTALTIVISSSSSCGAGGASAGEGSGSSGLLNTKGIPKNLPPIYVAAATKYKLGDWGPSILASINKTETDFGRNLNTSSAGAKGWMQFMPATWGTYGVDANGDGKKDWNNPSDAIFAAANYLSASAGRPKAGAWNQGLWARAIFSYNHADWYVQQILRDAKGFREGGKQVSGSASAAATPAPTTAAVASSSPSSVGYPLAKPGKYLGGVAAHKARPRGNWQSANAVDLGTPTGTGILAVGDGTIVKTGGSAPVRGGGQVGGFNITLKTADDSYFYTHLSESSVRPGQRVRAGQEMGASGFAAGVEHLHIGVMRGNPDELWGPGGSALGQAEATPVAAKDCGKKEQTSTGTAQLDEAQTLTTPRAYKPLPARLMAGERPPAMVDERIYNDAVWVLSTYNLRVTAGREAGHQTHGDGTALDMIPASGTAQQAWDDSAKKLATDLGWSAACGPSGVRPVCKLKPAIAGVFYNGYSGHGDPAHCSGTCAAHIHVSWESPCFGTSAPSPPCRSVKVFPAPDAGSAAGSRA